MQYSLYAANNPNWVEDALCGGQPTELFFPIVESDSDLEKINRNFCNHCPVRLLCLNSAIIHGDSGYWGGMTSAQRRSIRRIRSRSKCPVCLSVNMVAVGEHEVCVGCGASWKADDRPTVRQARLRGNTDKITEDVPLTEAAASCL
jgi:hypothetical protein